MRTLWQSALSSGLIALALGLFGAPPVLAKVGHVELSQVVAWSDFIGVGQVIQIRRGLFGKRVATAQILDSWKGEATTVRFVASPTWVCDTSEAHLGETVVLFLARGKLGRPSLIVQAGRGRMPVRESEAGPVADFWPEVLLPSGVATFDGPPSEPSFVRSVRLTELRDLVVADESTDIHP